MKKILTVLLAAAMVIVSPTCVFAAELGENEQVFEASGETLNGEKNIELEATIVSSYVIKLPIKVDVSGESTNVDIFAKGDVDGDKTIQISKKNDTNSLANTAKQKTAALTITFGSGISGKNVADDYCDDAKETMTIVHDALTAGSWSLQLPILIKLV